MRFWLSTVFLFSFVLSFSQSGVKFKEKPEWVKTNEFDYKASLPKSEISNGSFYIFYDEQYNLNKHSEYYHYAYKIVSDLGAQNNSELVFNYNPTYENFYFNSLTVIRKGERINYKNLAKISTAKREQNLEYSQIDASLSVIVIFPDIRAGDIIEYDYIQEGINPIFSNKDYVKLYFNSDIRFLNIYYRVIVDTANGFNIKYQNKAFLPTKSARTKSVKDLEWNYTNVAKITSETNYPKTFSPYSVVEIAQYDSWEGVEEWATKLFNLNANPSAELTKKIEELTTGKNTEEEKILSLIRFVQDEVRYFGIEIGVNSHLPQKPSITLNRRFGDCKDKSILLCYMLNSIGVKAYPVLIGTSYNAGLEKYLPSPHLFDHVIVYFYFARKKYFIDATIANQRGNIDYIYCPNYQKGLIVGDSNYGLDDILSNDYSNIVVNETYNIKSYTDTNAILTVKTKFAGDEADNTRSYFLNTSLDDIHTNYLNFYSTYYSKIEFVDSLKYEDDIAKNIFTVYEKYKIGDIWKKDDSLKNKKIKISFYATNISTFLNRYNTNKTKRTIPISLGFPAHYKQHTIINLPYSWNISYDHQEIETDYLSYSFSPTAIGKTVHLNWEFKTLKNSVSVEDYPSFIKSLSTIESYVGYELTKDLSVGEFDETSTAKNSSMNLITVNYFVFILLLFSVLYTKIYISKKHTALPLDAQTIYPENIGGWLILPLIGLVISPFIYSYTLFSSENFKQSTWDAFSNPGFGGWKFVVIFQITFITLFLCGTVFLSILFFNKDKRLPKYIAIYYVLHIIYDLFCVMFFLLLDSSLRDGIGLEVKAFIRSLIAGGIWIPYFLLSDRVKRTFLT